MAYQDKLQHLGIMKWSLLSVKAVVFFVSLVKKCRVFLSLTIPDHDFFTHIKELKFILAPGNRDFSRALFKIVDTVVFF